MWYSKKNDSINKLEAILPDTKKKDYIDVRFIKKLYEIDKKSIFIKDFIGILESCETSRQNGFKEEKNNPLAVLGRNVSLIAKIILENLFNRKAGIIFSYDKNY